MPLAIGSLDAASQNLEANHLATTVVIQICTLKPLGNMQCSLRYVETFVICLLLDPSIQSMYDTSTVLIIEYWLRYLLRYLVTY